MTEYKVGDKVRVEIEGAVGYVGPGGHHLDIIDDLGGVVVVASSVSTGHTKITKIVEVPTKTGALLYPYTPGLYRPIVRDQEGKWAVLGRPSFDVSEATVRYRLEQGSHYVAFEGVEE